MYVRTSAGLGRAAPTGSTRQASVVGRCPPLRMPKDIIDPRIDVFAQRSLLRLLKGDPGARADAEGMICAVKRGELAGIYKEDERVPALWAATMGLGWWQLIPKGEDVTLIARPDNSRSYLIVFRRQAEIRSNPARIDPALRTVWTVFQILRQQESDRCKAPGATVFAGSVDVRDTLGQVEDQCAISLSRAAICAGKGIDRRIDRAVCEFLTRVSNPRLIRNGQYYWKLLASDTVKTIGGQDCANLYVNGNDLYRSLSQHYLDHNGPKTELELAHWFVTKLGRQITACDVKALGRATGNKCFDTVNFMIKVLRRTCAFPVTEKSALDRKGYNVVTLADSASEVESKGMKRCVLKYRPSKDLVEKMKATLDNGHLIRAGVGNYDTERWVGKRKVKIPCVVSRYLEPGHYILVFGHDGYNRFVYWNTVYDCLHPYGQGFGEIRYDPTTKTWTFGEMKRNSYQLVSIVPIDLSLPKCKPYVPTSI